MILLTWNIEWANPTSPIGKRIQSLIEEIDPDVICFTEATLGMVPNTGHAIESDPDYGYDNHGNRRKVILWSKEPWDKVDNLGSENLPNGRFAAGITLEIQFVGICIPWRHAHVTTGRKDRDVWQDHLQYLDALKPLADEYFDSKTPVCFTGDFNQRLPRKYTPSHVFERLKTTFIAGYNFVTASIKDEEDKLLIDHVVIGDNLEAQLLRIIPKSLGPGEPISDHVGIVSEIRLA